MPPQHHTPQTLAATPLALTATRLDALTMDADGGIRSVLRALLEGADSSITDVKSWEEGRRYLRGHQGALVVLLDVRLPHPWDVALLQRALQRVLKRSAVPTRRRGRRTENPPGCSPCGVSETFEWRGACRDNSEWDER